MTDIFVIDVETTGLKPYPSDVVLQVGISRLNVEKRTIKPVYDEVIGYNIRDPRQWKKSWDHCMILADSDFSDLKLADIEKAWDEGNTPEKIGKEVRQLLHDKMVAIYNVGFDYGKFLRYDPFKISRRNVKILPCLMLYATPICKVPFEYNYYGSSSDWKWPRLEECVDIMLPEKIQKDLKQNINFHDAVFDTVASAHVLLEMIEKHNYVFHK